MKDFILFSLNPNGTLNNDLLRLAHYETLNFEYYQVCKAIQTNKTPRLLKTLKAYKKALLADINRRADLIPTEIIARVYKVKINNNQLIF